MVYQYVRGYTVDMSVCKICYYYYYYSYYYYYYIIVTTTIVIIIIIIIIVAIIVIIILFTETYLASCIGRSIMGCQIGVLQN